MKYTELSRKEQGRQRYGRQQDRYRAKAAKKTRPSDIRPKNRMDGVSGKTKPQTEFVSRFPAPRPKAMSYNAFQFILDAIDNMKAEESKSTTTEKAEQ